METKYELKISRLRAVNCTQLKRFSPGLHRTTTTNFIRLEKKSVLFFKGKNKGINV